MTLYKCLTYQFSYDRNVLSTKISNFLKGLIHSTFFKIFMQWNIEANPKKKEENAMGRYIQNVKHYNKLKYPITSSVIKY